MCISEASIIVALCVTTILCCDLSYRCNHGNYYVSNPEPRRFTYAKAEGCDTIISFDNRFILARMCKAEPTLLELHGTNGDTIACNLSCGAIRKRRASTWNAVSMQDLYRGGGIEDKVIQYTCNSAGIFFDNPRPELYNFVRAYSMTDGSQCQYDDPDEDNKILFVFGCPLEGKALIILSKKSKEENAIERHQNMELVDCSPFLPFETPPKTETSGDITYSCWQNGTITAVNRRPELWKYGIASNNDVPCTVIFYDNNAQLVIFGCPRVTLTLLVLSKTEDAGNIIIRRNNYFLLDCFT